MLSDDGVGPIAGLVAAEVVLVLVLVSRVGGAAIAVTLG
jgi:hypothetical protein